MKRKMKVLQIRGIKGLFFAMFCACCLIAGFIVFPGLLAMQVWNYFSYKTALIPAISIYGGVLLWAIIVVCRLILKKNHFAISFVMPKELTENEVKDVISRIKSQNNVSSVILPHDIENKSEEKKDENKEDLDFTSANSDKKDN